MEVLPVGGKLFYADRRTDTMKQLVAFRNFANEPKHLIAIEHRNIGVFRTVLCTMCDAQQQ